MLTWLLNGITSMLRPADIIGKGRFRHTDLVAVIDHFHGVRTKVAPKAVTEYRPRENTIVADYFAGCASVHLGMAKEQECPPEVNRSKLKPTFHMTY